MKRKVVGYSQHFLRGRSLIAELIGHSNIKRGDLVLDIGAGSGAISSVLSYRGCQVIAIEHEPSALVKLRQNLMNDHNIQIIDADIQHFDLPKEDYKVFSNIPFSLSSYLVRRLAFSPYPPSAIYLIVQRQFANKLIIDRASFHGALGVALSPWWQVKIRRHLHKYDFTPPPAVPTVLVELKPRPSSLLPLEHREKFLEFVEKCFSDQKYFARRFSQGSTPPSRTDLEIWLRVFGSKRSK